MAISASRVVALPRIRGGVGRSGGCDACVTCDACTAGALRSCSHSDEIAVTQRASACAEGARNRYERVVQTSSNSYLSFECIRTHLTKESGIRRSPGDKSLLPTDAERAEERAESEEEERFACGATAGADTDELGAGTDGMSSTDGGLVL